MNLGIARGHYEQNTEGMSNYKQMYVLHVYLVPYISMDVGRSHTPMDDNHNREKYRDEKYNFVGAKRYREPSTDDNISGRSFGTVRADVENLPTTACVDSIWWHLRSLVFKKPRDFGWYGKLVQNAKYLEIPELIKFGIEKAQEECAKLTAYVDGDAPYLHGSQRSLLRSHCTECRYCDCTRFIRTAHCRSSLGSMSAYYIGTLHSVSK